MSEQQVRRTRVAAYGLVVRGDQVLLCQLAPRVSREGLWHLPGGGIDFGEHPRDALVREIHEETGLDAIVGDELLVDSASRQVEDGQMHSVRIVYDASVPADAPDPRVVEVDGSTVAAAWHPVSGVLDGSVPTTPVVHLALEKHRPARLQRVAAYGLAVADDRVLLTRISARGHHPGAWTLPGGGVDHGESPADTVRREFVEETGLEVAVGRLLGVHDVHFEGTAPSGRLENYHGIHLVHEVSASGEPHVVEQGGTTDRVAWVPLVEVDDLELLDVARTALRWAHDR